MFKKTLIAAAVATLASSVAMADVSVSGAVKLTVGDTDGSTGDYAPSLDGSELTFKASEDLGNGITAFAQTTINNVAAGTAGGPSYKDQKLGLKGSFGTIVGGRMETLTEGAVSSMMDDGASTHEANTQLESSLTNFGRVNALAYISPTVNGVHVAVAGVLDGTNNATDDGDGMFRSTDLLIAYDNGPLSVKASLANLDGTGAAADTDVTTLAASYKVGDLKLAAMTVKSETDGAASVNDNMYRADYAMGNNVITLGMRDDEAGDDLTTVKLTHKMSKRTALWLGHRSKDAAAAGDVTHFGMIHKF
jgi:predicted porin